MEFGNENVRFRMEDDRISSLPDEIIHHILSFNDTKYAVQTSVLSSRWKLVWITLPYLKFSTCEFRILPKFSKFVNRVLSLRNNHTEVSSIDLSFRGPANQKFMQKIADYVVSHNVQKVNLVAWRHSAKEDHQFPLCFFSSQSLKHLSIKTNADVFSIFPLPQSPWDCPALTSIELKDVWLCDDNVVCLDLFSKCVNLMNLTLSNCRSRGLKLIKILCPRLAYLTISHCETSEYEIVAPNLSYFYYEDGYPPVLSTCGLNSLEKVNLQMPIHCSMADNVGLQRKALQFMNMLHQLRNAKFVTLYGAVIEFLSKAFDLLEHQPSPLCNLKCLSIEGLETPKTKKRAKSAMTQKVINFLLNSSPTATVSIEYQKETIKQSRRGTSYKESLTSDPNQVTEAIFKSPEFHQIFDAAYKKALQLELGIVDNTPSTHQSLPPRPHSHEGSSTSNVDRDVQAYLRTPKFQEMIDEAARKSVRRKIMECTNDELQKAGIVPSKTKAIHEMVDEATQKNVDRTIMECTNEVLQRTGFVPSKTPVIQNPPSPSPSPS